LAVDARDQVWVATDGGGLALMQGSVAAPDAIRFKVLSREEGLSSDTVYGVVTDAAGRVWVSGDAGLTRYDPESAGIKTYHREHGLQGEEFNFGAYLRLRDGRLAFGGPGGFNIFDPTRLTENRRPPHVALTRVEVLGAPAPGPKPYWLLERIDLGYRANILSLDFGALDFASRLRLQRLKIRQVVDARQRLESEVKLRTREITESNRQLAEAVRAKSDFLDRMSHELRTPMNGVVGMTELLTRTPLSSTQSRLTETIRSSARVLLQIVNDLLDLSKINAGKIALEVLPFDLGQVLEECASLFAGAAQAKGIELIVSPPPREHGSLRGDALRVRQILMNLI